MSDDEVSIEPVIEVKIGDNVRVEGPSETDFLVGKVVKIRDSSQTMHVQWYYTKQDILNDLDPDAFVGDYTQDDIVNQLTDRDLVLSNHCDGGNPIGSVIERVSVVTTTATPREQQHDEAAVLLSSESSWRCRFQMDIMHDEIHVYEIDEPAPAMRTKRRHSRGIESDDDYEERDHKRSRKHQSSTKRASQTAAVLSLWEIHGIQNSNLQAMQNIFPKRMSFDVQKVAHFFLFIHERQQIWERRRRGDPEPWSQSHTMSNYFFCNNYRELDRGTSYFRREMLNLKDHMFAASHTLALLYLQDWLEQVLWSSICYRLMNKIETFQEYGGIPSSKELVKFTDYLEKQRKARTSIFTSAHLNMGLTRYILTLNVVKKEMPKLVSKILDAQCEDPDNALQECYNSILGINNIGPFFAWQITCDLLECQCLPACDENDFCKLGKGAVTGLSLLMRSKPKTQQELRLVQMLQARQDDVYDCLGLEFSKFRGRSISVKNIEHALCEFQKYVAVQTKLRKREPARGQRRKRSRISLDLNKVCNSACGHEQQDNGQLCHTCRDAYCALCCQSEQPDAHWCCRRCVSLETMQFEY